MLLTTPDPYGYGVLACDGCTGKRKIVVQRVSGTYRGGKSLWSHGYGVGGGSGTGVSIAHGNNDGNLYVLARRDDNRYFIKKISQTRGNVLDEKGLPKGVLGTFIVHSPYNGGLYLAGHAAGRSLDGCRRPIGAQDAFVCKLNKQTLGFEWCNNMGSGSGEITYPSASNLCFDMHGNIFLAGSTTGSLPGNNNLGGSDAFVAKMDAQGNVLWYRQVGSWEKDTGVGCSYDTYYDWVYLLGQTNGQVGQKYYGGMDVFLAQINGRDSNVNWIAQYGNYGDDVASDIQSFHNRVFFLLTTPAYALKTYWLNDGIDVPASNNKTWNHNNVRWLYNNDLWGGNEVVACEVANVGGPIYPDWTEVPTGMAKWCSIFGSTGNDVAKTLRVLPNYDLTWVASVTGQYISDGPGNPPVGIPRGAEDVAIQYYWEYDPPWWPGTPEAKWEDPSRPVDCPLKYTTSKTRTTTKTTSATRSQTKTRTTWTKRVSGLLLSKMAAGD